jgi:GT2 family glycosyltransferase
VAIAAESNGPSEALDSIAPVAPPAISVLLDVEGWPDDAARFLASLERHCDRSTLEVVEMPAGVGFGAGCNLALGAATGAVVVLVDTSLELTGDLLRTLAAALDDPTVAVAGPFGLATADLCDYEERTAGDVAAIQGYCLAARRADLVAAGGVQEAFTWYRNADIDVSLRLRTLSEPTRRALAVGAEQCVRHTHRAWEATPEAERGERSRHNMGIVHEVFFGRKDLTVL